MQIAPPLQRMTPKQGNSFHQCEDAVSVRYEEKKGRPRQVKAALADGASEAAFASRWSQLLAQSYSAAPPAAAALTPAGLAEWLQAPQEQWRQAVPWPQIPWHGRKKAEYGALATLLGLTLSAPARAGQPWTWQAAAVGDSCLFPLHKGRLQQSFPLESPDQFGSSPPLLCSNPAHNEKALQTLQLRAGECRPGDSFLLASDAVAYWLLKQVQAGQEPWPEISRLRPEQWPLWIQARRDAKEMPNDDATMLLIRCRPSGSE